MFDYIYYSDDKIQVTDDWVKLNDLAYPVADIKSARLSKVCDDPLLPWARVLVSSGLLTFVVAIAAYAASVTQGKDLTLVIVAVGMLAALNLGAGLLMREFHKPEYRYVVSIRGPFGKTTAVESGDESYVRKVVAAIHKATSKYR